MTVCFLSQAFVRWPDDHIGSFVYRLSKGIHDRGINVVAVVPHAQGLAVEDNIGGVRVVRFRYAPDAYECLAYSGQMHRMVARNPLNLVFLISFMVMFAIQAVRTMRREHCDVIHAHWWFPSGVVGAITSLLTGRPLIITGHGTDIALLETHSLVRMAAHAVFRRAAAITVVSPYLKRRLLRHLPDLQERISVIPMPVEKVFSDTNVAPPRQQRNGSFTILAVARLARSKGLQDLIAAGRLLIDRGIHLQLLLIGDGSGRMFLEKIAEQLGVQRYVNFLGPRRPSELAAFYRSSDVCVLPSYEEGLGLVLVEAMFCGTPVVGARSGGIPDVISDGCTGLLVAPGDVTGLAGALQKIIIDRPYAQRLARTAQWHVRHAYDPDDLINRTVLIYQVVLHA